MQSDSRKNALITGGTQGMGKCMVERLAKLGINIAFTGTKEKPEMADEIAKQYGIKCISFGCDFSDLKNTEKLIEDVLKFFDGKVDILVNNAAITYSGAFVDTSIDDFKRVMDVNVYSPYMLMKAFAPLMTNNKWGRIVNISSITTKCYLPHVSAYVASKNTLNSLTKSLAREVGSGVTCNNILPGITNTKLLKDGLTQVSNATGKSEDEVKSMFVKDTITKLIVEPDEIARMVEYLISDESKNITGASYEVSGGHSI